MGWTLFWIAAGIFFVFVLVAAVAGEQERSKLLSRKPSEVEHLNPRFRSCKYGYTSIHICTECGARGSHWDHMFCLDPCRFCGAENYNSCNTTGKWNSKTQQWETRREIRNSESSGS